MTISNSVLGLLHTFSLNPSASREAKGATPSFRSGNRGTEDKHDPGVGVWAELSLLSDFLLPPSMSRVPVLPAPPTCRDGCGIVHDPELETQKKRMLTSQIVWKVTWGHCYEMQCAVSVCPGLVCKSGWPPVWVFVGQSG